MLQATGGARGSDENAGPLKKSNPEEVDGWAVAPRTSEENFLAWEGGRIGRTNAGRGGLRRGTAVAWITGAE